ncbi:hypothetical protein EJ110_NYTH05621 [Nymphaea thermarum]|nr:hypothetical protein EJ110_NYTH05621 [Nymphaea thermarum]
MTSRKFGGRQPTGTPSVGWSAVVVIASLLAGASVVHNIFKPDLDARNLILLRYGPTKPILAFRIRILTHGEEEDLRRKRQRYAGLSVMA